MITFIQHKHNIVFSTEIKCNLEVKARMNKIILCYLFWNMNNKSNNSSNL